MHFSLDQGTRAALLVIDIGLLAVASKLAFDVWFPPLGDDGFWFYAALLGLLLGSRLVTPFYSKPVDAISYATAATMALLLVNDWVNWSSDERLLFSLVTGFCIVVVVAAFVQIFFKDSHSDDYRTIANNLRAALDLLGTPKVVYSLVTFFAIYAFHRDSAQEVFWIGAAWAVTVALSPIDDLLLLGKRLRYQWKAEAAADLFGDIVAYQDPNVILFRQAPGVDLPFGQPVLVSDLHAPACLAVVADFVGRDSGLLRRAIQLGKPLPKVVQSVLGSDPRNSVLSLSDEASDLLDEGLRADVYRLENLVGIVSPETSVERMFFEVLRDEGVQEGRLVEVDIADQPVIYQIVDALTKEEVVQQKNTHGFARAQAQKVGVWDAEKRRFKLAKWLPAPNSPVYLKETRQTQTLPDAVGHFPETDYSVGISSIHDLVTHNTAILGILGVGKSMLSIELIERMLSAGIKVVVLDLTNQYAEELADFLDPEVEKAAADRIRKSGEQDQDQWQENPEQGGSLPNFIKAIRDDLEVFIGPGNLRGLRIYNPAQMFATRQQSEPRSYQAGGAWQRGAALWTVTPVEITRIVSEVALSLVQDEMVDYARVCLVYEEAHSLVPEWNSVAFEGDRVATSGTARAILQGRKYGLGCLLITQRTANVTKTILNQCNTIFAMRTFDETGKDFLANYIGRDYATSLSALAERHAVFFGKASTCENPVLIRLSDRKDFLRAFRASPPSGASSTPGPVSSAGAEGTVKPSQDARPQRESMLQVNDGPGRIRSLFLGHKNQPMEVGKISRLTGIRLDDLRPLLTTLGSRNLTSDMDSEIWTAPPDR